MNQYTPSTPPPTFESVWAAMQENNRYLTERLAESDRLRQENERILNEKFAETDRQIKETAKQMRESRADYDRRMKELNKSMGSFTNNQGTFAEEYFFNSFEKGKRNFFGEKFDEIKRHVTHFWQGVEDEYDIVLYNHHVVALIEVKYKAHLNDIPTVLKKPETFRILFPNCQDFKIYLGLASMMFYPELEEECIKQGIVVIKQVGDKVVICDENLKAF